MADLIISIHALERMEERWPKLCKGLNDAEVGRFIQGEVNDAFLKNRQHRVCPLELANSNVHKWKVEKNVWYLWTEGKDRGYVIADRDDKVTVLTTLVGQNKETAKRKLRRH